MTLIRRALVPVWVLATVAATLGCQRQTGPSAEFDRAHKGFTKLYAEKLDDAYLDPRIGQIEDDLHKVSPRSIDAPEAATLLKRIVENRERMLKEAEERKTASEGALKPTDNFAPSAPLYEAPDAAVAVEDAGTPQPVGGMSRAEFEKNFLGCFEPGDPIDIQGRGLRDSYRLKDITNCRDRHPGFDRQLVLMEGAKVLGTVPRSALFTAYADGGRAPSDAGAPPAADAGPAAGDAGADDAGAPRY